MAKLDISRSTHAETSNRYVQLVTFRLGGEEYGVDIMKVQEIIKLQETTHMPKMPAFIEGVINLRGNVIPIFDLRKRFDIPPAVDGGASAVPEMTGMSTEGGVRPPTTCSAARRIIVVALEGCAVGFIVDKVVEVMKVDESQVAPPPAGCGGVGREFLRGVCKLESRLVIYLDVDSLLSKNEAGEIRQV